MSLREATTTRLEAVFRYPADLAVTSAFALLAYYLLTSVELGSELRLLITLALVLFVPGYALVSVLFPARRRTVAADEGATYRGVDVAERVGLALALSIALVPVVAIALSLSAGLTTETLAGAFAGLAVALSQLGVVRRLRVPRVDRFALSSIRVFQRPNESEPLATASTILLVLAVAVAGAAFAFAFVSPSAAGGFTQLGLYTEDDGDLVAGGFPSDIEPGESIPYVVEVENQEGDDRTYTAVVQQQVLEDDEVVDRTTLESFTVEADDGEAVQTERTTTPTVANETVRVVVLLYEGEAPVEPTRETADEDAFFWVDVVTEEAEETEDLGVDDGDDGADVGLNDEVDDEEEPDEDDGLLDDGIDAVQDGIDAVGGLFDDDD